MKFKKSIAAVCALTFLCSCLAGCAGGNAAAASTQQTITAQEETTVKSYIPNSENVKTLGRTHALEDSLWLAFSGSGAEFTFNGTKASVTIAGDVNAANANNEDNQVRIGIYVNGERVIDDMINAAEETYTVFESETAQDVTVKIVKLSETAMSTCGIKDITVESEEGIKPAPAKEHFIEFIGDSITCGYGVDDEVKENHFSTKTEDVTKAYAYQTAEALNADYSMVSISGYGIISGYTDNNIPKPQQTIPQYYTKHGFSYGAYGSKIAASTKWDFTGYTPDLIVVNLGTNDDSYTQNDTEKQEEYCTAYVEFLKTIRENNPDAKILCTLGIMGDRLFPYVEKAVHDYTEQTGDTNIDSMKFDVQSPDDGYAADWHPTVATHTKASAKLVEKIKELMGW
ncbi:MAG: GDSL family lipase [Oscillospiraceae bacterium]|nr:GDSL family lipase [Oscillospiraceae bacterium]